MVLIVDFGSQYTQLIARRVRELHIYSEIHPFDHLPENIADFRAIILSGSPNSVHAPEPYLLDMAAIVGKAPILGICYGSQLIAHTMQGKVLPSELREYGRSHINIAPEHPLFEGVPQSAQVWMSHGDSIMQVPEGFRIIATTPQIPIAAFEYPDQQIFGLQFHPEVSHTPQGLLMLKNFLYRICNIAPTWTPQHFVESTIAALQQQVQNAQVLLALSGGVDSSVAAALLHRAIGMRLHCIFVDNGLLRKNEFEAVLQSYKTMGLNVKGVDAKAVFYENLKGISEPERKRKIIGKTFIDIFEAEARRLPEMSFLAQGTIYPDVVESFGKHSASIKSHHNVGGLPEKMHLKVVEPLRLLFKDEVRKVGAFLQVPQPILQRHPFPGPGLAIRILGEVNEEKVQLLQEADAIFIQGLRREGLYHEVWQAGVILLPVYSVGVMGDERTYEQCVALRAVSSVDGMTADWVPLPYDFLAKVSNDIINSVKGINRVVYDISSKPPATIEWE
ncbi:MAG: glutamine-hydrolyzing GMP synthase [Sphingobacteriales bacterium]|nr:glutamine-hydrolyzing GMP synthase [Sphingobacteriales bacterium]